MAGRRLNRRLDVELSSVSARSFVPAGSTRFRAEPPTFRPVPDVAGAGTSPKGAGRSAKVGKGAWKAGRCMEMAWMKVLGGLASKFEF